MLRTSVVLVVLVLTAPTVFSSEQLPWSAVYARSGGYYWMGVDGDSEDDCEKNARYLLSKAEYAKWRGAATKCVYTGSTNKWILKLRNFGNSAVLCIAKIKWRDRRGQYRVVLIGNPQERDGYRCE